MDFTPHTTADVERDARPPSAWRQSDDLFAHSPRHLRTDPDPGLPEPLSEPEVMAPHRRPRGPGTRLDLVCFAGGGIYDHYLPPVVRALTMRPEFVTSYTPYQSEVAQGVLQALCEYQSMVAAITGLPVANASLYDGATSGTGGGEPRRRRHRALRRCGSRAACRPTHPGDPATFARARDLDIVEHPLVGGRHGMGSRRRSGTGGGRLRPAQLPRRHRGLRRRRFVWLTDAGRSPSPRSTRCCSGSCAHRAPPGATSPSPRASRWASPMSFGGPGARRLRHLRGPDAAHPGPAGGPHRRRAAGEPPTP